MALDFTSLEAALAENDAVDDSAAALMTALFNEVEANKTNPAALQALVDRGRAANAKLAAAVLANTPSAPPVVPPVDPPVDPSGRPRR